MKKVVYLFWCFLAVFMTLPWKSQTYSLSFHFPGEAEGRFYCHDTYKKNFFDRHHEVQVKLQDCYLIYPENRIQCNLAVSGEEKDHKGYTGYRSLTIATEKDPYKCIQLSENQDIPSENVTLSSVKLWGIINDTNGRWFYQRNINKVYDLSEKKLGDNYGRKRFEFTFTYQDTQLCQYSIEFDKKNIEFYQ
ncbi:hypothetical protein PIROE2DRAFT_21582 [Piromyces sp. E2]|nr:hypothetical protein PIROE2DRAFT_21582 [Piromyces sp. E2]|eukprot:OUM56797.1 hypothetical protein PIROE2DRAFT_21582 [Piromyces sp. E2]